MKALARAADRDVKTSMLLEASNARGGNLSFDAFGKMKAALPTAWGDKTSEFVGEAFTRRSPFLHRHLEALVTTNVIMKV